MAFSLTGTIRFLDSCPENEVMDAIAQQYEQVSESRGIFSDSFIPFTDLAPLGYAGVKLMLTSLYETNPEFVEQNRHELYSITRVLKGDN